MKQKVIIHIEKLNDQTIVRYGTNTYGGSFPCMNGMGINNAIIESIKDIRKMGDTPSVKDERPKSTASSIVSITIKEVKDEHDKLVDLNSDNPCWLSVYFRGETYGENSITKHNSDVIRYIKNAIKIIKSHGDSAIIEDYVKKERAEEIFKHNARINKKMLFGRTRVEIDAWDYGNGNYYVCDNRYSVGIKTDDLFGVKTGDFPWTLKQAICAVVQVMLREGICRENICVNIEDEFGGRKNAGGIAG